MKKTLYWILMLLPLAAVLIALQFLPDQIPAHYGVGGQVDRWGSKYETLIFPALTAVFGITMLAISKYASKREENGTNNEGVILTAGLFGMLLFDAMTLFFLFLDFRRIEDLSAAPVDLYQLLFGVLGLGMVVIGNVMPKVRMNSLIGLRTSWSMSSEEAWKKSQRFGGIAFIAGGLGIVLVSLLTKGTACFLCSMSILTAVTVIAVIYTYHAAKKC